MQVALLKPDDCCACSARAISLWQACLAAAACKHKRGLPKYLFVQSWHRTLKSCVSWPMAEPVAPNYTGVC